MKFSTFIVFQTCSNKSRHFENIIIYSEPYWILVTFITFLTWSNMFRHVPNCIISPHFELFWIFVSFISSKTCSDMFRIVSLPYVIFVSVIHSKSFTVVKKVIKESFSSHKSIQVKWSYSSHKSIQSYSSNKSIQSIIVSSHRSIQITLRAVLAYF